VHDVRDVPSGWREAPLHHLRRAALQDRAALRATVEALRAARQARRPRIVLLDPALPWARILAPEREHRPLWTLGADHRLLRDELAFLLGADLYDARSGDPVWWPAVRARRLGCTLAGPSHDADVFLPDGRAAWIDGGPRGPLHDRSDGTVRGAVRIHRESVELVGRLDVERDTAPREQLSDRAARRRHPPARGPARVLAPAGSGKTRVLAARLRHLVHDRGVQPGLITALAYNTRAAQELAERTRDVVADGAPPAGSAPCTRSASPCAPPRSDAAPSCSTSQGVDRLLHAASDGRVGRRHGPALDAVLAALTDVRLGLRDPADVERATRGDVPGLATLVPRYRRAAARARGCARLRRAGPPRRRRSCSPTRRCARGPQRSDDPPARRRGAGPHARRSCCSSGSSPARPSSSSPSATTTRPSTATPARRRVCSSTCPTRYRRHHDLHADASTTAVPPAVVRAATDAARAQHGPGPQGRARSTAPALGPLLGRWPRGAGGARHAGGAPHGRTAHDAARGPPPEGRRGAGTRRRSAARPPGRAPRGRRPGAAARRHRDAVTDRAADRARLPPHRRRSGPHQRRGPRRHACAARRGGSPASCRTEGQGPARTRR
jgi:hypothetical protein